MIEPLTDDEVLRQDVFPAEVLLPDGTVLSGVRVFATSHRLVVYGENPVGPVLVEELETPWSIEAHMGTLFGQLQCDLASGGTAWVNRGRGCGCGSVLKALAAPLPRMRRQL